LAPRITTPELARKFIEEQIQELRAQIGDKKVLLALSGGVDSSYVLAMSDAKFANSCGYDDSRLDESGLAKVTADILKRNFNRCLITPEMYFDIVPYVMYNMEQPLGDASAVAFALSAVFCALVIAASGLFLMKSALEESVCA
jgi:asparagine synthetase B (glutamine-hydrolysing)